MGQYEPISIVDIVKYEPDMEDGYLCHTIGTDISKAKYYKKDSYLPRNERHAAIETFEGPICVVIGDYIITDSCGRRWVCDKNYLDTHYKRID